MTRLVCAVVLVAACAGPGDRARGEVMPSAVLAHQDPGADTSHNPELSRSEARNWFERLLGLGLPPVGPALAPAQVSREHYVGCHGCGAGDGGGALLVLVAPLLLRSRRLSDRAARPVAVDGHET